MLSIYCGHHGYRIEEFKSFPNHKSMQAIDPQGLDKFSRKGPDWWDLCREQLDIAIHTKFI